MSKIICPECLGAGETLYLEKKLKICKTCEGIGEVHPDIANTFLDTLNFETDY